MLKSHQISLRLLEDNDLEFLYSIENNPYNKKYGSSNGYLSKKTLKRLLRGKFNAFEITDGIEERFERNAEKGGIENPLIPVESLIKQMVKDFENQSLDNPLQLNTLHKTKLELTLR